MLRRHEELIDAAVPVLVGAVIVTGEVLHGGDTARPWPVAIALAASGVLWARRRWPGWTLLASGALAAVLLHLSRPAGTVAVLAPAVALYSFALTRGRRAQLIGGLAAIAAVLIAELAHARRPGALRAFGHVLLVARGLSNDEIAGRFVISPLTAKTHVRNILRKLDCRDRAGLVAVAYETALVTPGNDLLDLPA